MAYQSRVCQFCKPLPLSIFPRVTDYVGGNSVSSATTYQCWFLFNTTWGECGVMSGEHKLSLCTVKLSGMVYRTTASSSCIKQASIDTK